MAKKFLTQRDLQRLARQASGGGKSSKKDLEGDWLGLWNNLAGNVHRWVNLDGPPEPERQVKFHPSRNWAMDFGWPIWKVAVEIQGGAFVKGAHVRGVRQAEDFRKLNAAMELGWICHQFNVKNMESEPGRIVEQVASTIDSRAADLAVLGEWSTLTSHRQRKGEH